MSEDRTRLSLIRNRVTTTSLPLGIPARLAGIACLYPMHSNGNADRTVIANVTNEKIRAAAGGRVKTRLTGAL